MKTISENIQMNLPLPKTLNSYLQASRIGTFDIETTGLSSKNSLVVLTGFVIFDLEKGTTQVKQFFAEHPGEEKEVLTASLGVLESLDMVITYNGNNFDYPFVKDRLARYRMPSYAMPYNLDLYIAIKKNFHLKDAIKKSMGSLSQKSIEKYMGIEGERIDQIDGGKSVNLYNVYQERPSAQLEALILRHNYDDVLQLARLCAIIKSMDLPMTMYSLGFISDSCKIESINITSDLYLEGSILENCSSYISFPTTHAPYSISIDEGSVLSPTSPFKVSLTGKKIKDFVVFDLEKIFNKINPKLLERRDVKEGFIIVKNGSSINFDGIIALIQAFISLVMSPIIEEIKK